MSNSNTLLTTALAYAARGWHVFPLHPESKRPACPDHRAADCTGSDPWCRSGHTGWEERATTDPARITRAWSSTPYGIGIATGPSGLVVVDLDIPKDDDPPSERWARHGAACGRGVLALLAAEFNAVVPDTYTIRTISGGTHLYFTPPRRADQFGLRIGNTAGTLGWLIDTRAAGGYVVAPPTTISGCAYTALDGHLPPAPLPDWLTGLLTRHTTPAAAPAPRAVVVPADRLGRYVAAAVAGETCKVTTAPSGQRNRTLFCAAVALGQLVAGGQLPEADAHAALLAACAAHIGVDGFTETEAESAILSGLHTGARNPRTAA